MGNLLASLIVPALLIAVNPVPIIAVVTLLTTAHGKRNAGAFAATLVVVMLAVGLATIFLLGKTGSSSQSSTTTGMAVLQTLFGLAFLTLAVLQWRSKPSASGETPKWMTAVDKAGFSVAVVLGVSLTNYALLSAGGATILKSGVTSADKVAALLFFIVLATSTVVVPLILYFVRRTWADVQLGRLRGWLERHNRVLLISVFGLMGALFTAQGLTNLLH
jgi:hypothetical protein